MVLLKQPSLINGPWFLSGNDEKDVFFIDEDVTKDLNDYHVLGINFLYQNYKIKLQGAILNEDNDMNPILQVCCFLNSVQRKYDNFLILIICPENSMKYWKYHLNSHAKLDFIEVYSEITNFDAFQGKKLALLIDFSNLNLVDYLVDLNYFSVIFDDFDLVATKRNAKKLSGNFNIGLTKRNFILNKDQKLKWTMLNWSNKGCVGKLADFYNIDNENRKNLRDNYRHWWFRLTWKYSENFQKISSEDLMEYNKKVNNFTRNKTQNNSKYASLDINTVKRTNNTSSVKRKSTNTYDNISPNKSFEEILVEMKKRPKTSSFIDCTQKKLYSPKNTNKRQRKLRHYSSEEDLEKGFDKEIKTEHVPIEDFFKHSYCNSASTSREKDLQEPACSKKEDENKEIKTENVSLEDSASTSREKDLQEPTCFKKEAENNEENQEEDELDLFLRKVGQF